MNNSQPGKNIWFSIIVMISFLTLIIYFIATYQFAFNYQVLFNENYNLSFACCLFLGFYTLNAFSKTQLSYYSVILISIFNGLLIYSYYVPNREYLIVILCLSIVYFSLKETKPRCSIYLISIFSILFACSTLFSFYSFINRGVLAGIINNPGILGIYTAISFPVIFYYIIYIRSRSNLTPNYFLNGRLIFFCLACFALMAIYIIIKSESRTAITTIIVIVSCYIKRYWIDTLKNKIFINVIYLTGIFTTIILALWFFVMASPVKERSLSGRLLMSKIAGSHLFDNFWFGTGVGRFSWFYPQWQADFFKGLSSNISNVPITNVGESYIILNEFLQIFLTVGVIGTFLMIYFLVHLLTAKSKRFSHLFFCLKSAIIGILISSTASYPLHVNIILLYLLTCSSVLLIMNENQSPLLFFKKNVANKYFTKSLCTISLLTCYTVALGYWYKLQAVTKWHELKDTYSSFEIAEKKYDQIYPCLKFDGKFLIDYGTFILENDPTMKPKKIEKAIKMLECAKQNLISREGMESLAYGYWVKKDYIQASKHFEWVSNFLPHLFAPKLALMKLNLHKGNYKKAKELSIWIISTVPKINSREVEIIKSEAESLAKQFNL